MVQVQATCLQGWMRLVNLRGFPPQMITFLSLFCLALEVKLIFLRLLSLLSRFHFVVFFKARNAVVVWSGPLLSCAQWCGSLQGPPAAQPDIMSPERGMDFLLWAHPPYSSWLCCKTRGPSLGSINLALTRPVDRDIGLSHAGGSIHSQAYLRFSFFFTCSWLSLCSRYLDSEALTCLMIWDVPEGNF